MKMALFFGVLVTIVLVYVGGTPINKHEFLRRRRSIDLISSQEHVSDTRLPRDVTPTGYRLELQPFLEEGEFQGHVSINITCQEDTDKITLHAHHELEVAEGDVTVTTIPAHAEPTTTTSTTTEAPVAPVPVGAARLLPASSSFVPENGCTSTTSCSTPGHAGHSGHNTLHHTNGKHGRHDEEEVVEAETSASNQDSAKKAIPALTVMANAHVVKEEPRIAAVPHVVILTISKIERLNSKQWYIIHLADRLKRGEHYLLDLKFTGPLLGDSKDGFFTDFYTDKDTGEKRQFAATQLRPNHARRVYPCFDEPSFKVPFEVSIAHPANLSAISNMPVERTEQSPSEPGWVWDHFQRTQPMSTYTLSLVVSDLQSILPSDTVPDKEHRVRVWGRSELLPNLQTAADIAPLAIRALEEYLATPLPVPKLDIVALPSYTAIPDSNWGLIIFKESELVSDDYLLKHITREIVYQWVGNLITPHWWSEVHINKALANFIAHAVSLQIDNMLIPNSNLWVKNYPLYYEYGRTHPHKQLPTAKIPNQVTKSELVLRMLNYTLSGPTFQKGIQQLLGERQLKTFTQDDIWSALTGQAGMDDTLPEPSTVNQIAESWQTKDRLPFIKVTRDYEKNSADVEQSVFIRDLPESGIPAPDENLLWWIPLVVIAQNKLDFHRTKPQLWMKEERRVTLNDLPSSAYFIIVNPDEIGPFLVNYDRKNWFMIADYLERYSINDQIPPATRAKLVHDALNLAYAGKLRFDSALNVTKFLLKEKDPIVWQPAFNMFDHIQRHIEGTETSKKFQDYIKVVLGPAYSNLEKALPKLSKSQDRMLKSAKSALCNAGYEPCIEEARREWRRWMEADDPDAGIPIHQFHFCWVFKWGSREEWEFGLERYFRFPPNHKQSDRYYLLKTLVSCPNDSWNVERLLNLTMLDTNSTITDGNTRFILSVLSNEVGYTALFNLLADNWDAIKNRYDSKESGLWGNIVSAATRNFKNQDGLDMVSELYVERQGEFGGAEAIIEQSLKHIKVETKWNEDNLSVIDQWLENYLSAHSNFHKG